MQSILPPSYHGTSLWHQMDARWKVAGVLCALAALPWIRFIAPALSSLLLSLVLLSSAGIPPAWWRDRLIGVGFFLLLFLLVLPFTVGEPTWTWSFFTIRKHGVELALIILLKSLAAVALTLLLIGTTTMEAILHALTRLGLPSPLLRVLMITWRYVRIMYDSINRFRIALRLRGFRNRVNWRTYQSIAGVIGTLLVQGLEHTERVSHAMRCRGYHGRVETLERFHSRSSDILLFCLLAGGFILLSASIWWLG